MRIGVLPEKIDIHSVSDAPEATHNAVRATLRSAVFVGLSYQYFFETPSGGEMSAFDRNTGRGAAARPGEEVRLAWKPEHTFVMPVDAAPTGDGSEPLGEER